MKKIVAKIIRKVSNHRCSQKKICLVCPRTKLCPIKTPANKIAKLMPRVCKPAGEEHAEHLKRHGNFHSIGENCSILTSTVIEDPDYISIGNNVRLAGCSLYGHDGSIAMLNRAYGVKLDNVGKIVIHDNVFIGKQAIIMPGVTIGPNSIVGAGAIVTRDVMPGDIVAGSPARKVGRVEELVERLKKRTSECPWGGLIEQRNGTYDPAMEPELRRLRIAHFYPDKKD